MLTPIDSVLVIRNYKASLTSTNASLLHMVAGLGETRLVILHGQKFHHISVRHWKINAIRNKGVMQRSHKFVDSLILFIDASIVISTAAKRFCIFEFQPPFHAISSLGRQKSEP